MNNMKIIALDNIKEIGKEINAKLNKLRNTNKNYMLNITSSRFSNGEGKVKIEDYKLHQEVGYIILKHIFNIDDDISIFTIYK